MTNQTDTIYALASGAGKSAVAIIRVSGPQCGDILNRLCKRQVWPEREVIYTGIFEAAGGLIDRAIVLVFHAPRSFTGEDMIEFQITGGRGVKSLLFRNLANIVGTRPAEPGEFARRAFENGKLDLLQVEGLAAIVDAETEAEARHSALLAFGNVSRECEVARSELLKAAAHLEGFLDFSDVEDPSEASISTIFSIITRAWDILEPLRERFCVAERLRDGYTVAIIGEPNAGKSTLINCLLRRDAVLVSEIPGTTRDCIEFFVELRGFPIIFVDTAGLRETSDPVEALGIRKTQDRIHAADLLLWVSETGNNATAIIPGDVDTMTIRSKCDLSDSGIGSAGELFVSAHTGHGIGNLVEAITSKAEAFFEEYLRPGLGSERQVSAVSDALTCINRILTDKTQPTELIAEEIRSALVAVGRISGRVDVEDVLDEIFSRLCIGK